MDHFLKYNRFCFHPKLLKTDMGENKSKKKIHTSWDLESGNL